MAPQKPQQQNGGSKIPPNDIEAEQSVLGSVLIDHSMLERVTEATDGEFLLDAGDFYDPKHALIFQAMVDLHKTSDGLDLLTLDRELAKRGQIDKIGGGAYLCELTTIVPTSSHITSYAKLVKRSSVQRKFMKLGDEIARIAESGNLDAAELSSGVSKMVDNVTSYLLTTTPLSADKLVERWRKGYDAKTEKKRKGENLFFEIGFPSLGQAIKPSAGKLIVIAAKTSHGKSALTLDMSLQAAEAGHPVVSLSGEMIEEETMDRALAYSSMTSLNAIDYANLSPEKVEQIIEKFYKKAKDNYYYRSLDMKMSDIWSAARFVRNKHGRVDLIFVDYLGLIKADEEDWKRMSNQNRAYQIGQLTKELKKMARDMKAAVVLLTQFSRAAEDKNKPDRVPTIYDIKDSSDIEQDADVVIILHKANTESAAAEALVKKNRGGMLGSVLLDFEGEHVMFKEADEFRPTGISSDAATQAEAAGEAEVEEVSAVPRPEDLPF